MKLKNIMVLMVTVSAISIAPVYAGETWDSVKLAASNVANKTVEVAGDVAERTREVAGDAVDRSKEVGEDISNSDAWKKTKEVGNATAEAAKSGVNKAKGYINSHACDKKDKLNCKAEQ